MGHVVGLTPLNIKIIIDYLRENLETDEPVDAFTFCNKAKLDACLKTPFQRPEKETQLDEVVEKTSLVFYFLVENHVLPTNGNKRLATHAFLSMAYINNYEISASETDLYGLSLSVTQLTKQGEKQENVVDHIKNFAKRTFTHTDHGMLEQLRPYFEEYLYS